MMHRMLSKPPTGVLASGLNVFALMGLIVPFLGSVGCGDPCDSVASRLRVSQPGDVVEASGCTLQGELRVPAGVTLRGPAILSGSVALETALGSTTSLSGIDVTSERTAISTTGPGTAAIDDAVVHVTRGVGLSLGAAETLVGGLILTGNVTEANRDESRWLSVTSATEATHGVVIGGGTVRIRDSAITGFAWAALSAGPGLVEGASAIIDLGVERSVLGHGLGVGLSSSAPRMTLDGVRIEEVWSGVRGWPSYALLLIDGQVTTVNTVITNADGFGLVEIAGSSEHGDLVIEHTGDVGAWFGTDVEAGFIGRGTRIADTGFAGILAVDAASLVMIGGTIEGVRAERRTVGVRGAIEVGDGIDAIGTDVALRDLSISGAERVGLLLDGAIVSPGLVNLRITSEGTGLGAVQGTIDRSAEDFTVAATPGWDVGITRVGAAAVNDAAFTGSLAVAIEAAPPSASDALGVIAPMY